MIPVVFRNRISKRDIETLKASHDLPALTKLLRHRHTDIQWQAAEALGALGRVATAALKECLSHYKVAVRLGAIEALTEIKDPASLEALIEAMNSDPNNEVRWACAIALGQFGDPRAISPLMQNISHPDKYIRFGAAQSLQQLGWIPNEPERRAEFFFALQDWASLKAVGQPAIPLLTQALSDKDRDVRDHIVEILGQIRYPEARQACDNALSDPDNRIRWKAVLASKKCGVAMIEIPWFVSRRPRIRPNPYAAAVLNLFFVGLGYNYLGKWWGFLIFMSYMTIMVIISLEVSLGLPYFNVYPNLYSYPVTAVFAVQTYYMARKVPDL